MGDVDLSSATLGALKKEITVRRGAGVEIQQLINARVVVSSILRPSSLPRPQPLLLRELPMPRRPLLPRPQLKPIPRKPLLPMPRPPLLELTPPLRPRAFT